MHIDFLARGVQLFFVISGFILAQPFVREYVDGGKPVSLLAFYKRRLTRLEPPYIISLLICAAAFILTRGQSIKVIGISFLTSVFYVHNYFHGLQSLNFPCWSLEVEVEFYVIAPLLAMLYLIRPTLLRRSLLVVFIALAAISHPNSTNRIGFLLPGQICFFLTGYLLADLRIGKLSSLRHWGWDIVSLICWPALFLTPDRADSDTLCPLLFICFCSSLLGPVSRRVVGARWIALIGGMCYSLYLTHMIVISAIFPLTRHAFHTNSLVSNYLIQLMFLLPAVVAVGFAYYILIERPCMDPEWPSKLRTKLFGNHGFGEDTSILPSGDGLSVPDQP